MNGSSYINLVSSIIFAFLSISCSDENGNYDEELQQIDKNAFNILKQSVCIEGSYGSYQLFVLGEQFQLGNRYSCFNDLSYDTGLSYTSSSKIMSVLYGQDSVVKRICETAIGGQLDNLHQLKCSDYSGSLTDDNTRYLEVSIDNFTSSGNIVDIELLNTYLSELEVDLPIALIFGDQRYYVESSIKVSHSVKIFGPPDGNAEVISTNVEGHEILNITSPVVFETTIHQIFPSNQELGLSKFPSEKVQHCEQMIIVDKSKLWPLDERDNVFFGEINYATKFIEERVYLAEPIRDDYSVDTFVYLSCPIEVEIRNISISYSSSSHEASKAIIVKGAKRVSVENIRVENSSKAALWISESSNVKVSNSRFKNGFTEGCKTCYGIQTYGVQDGLIENNIIEGFRRGIDISGHYPSRRIVVANNHIVATSDKDKGASALGTHGSALEVLFVGNETQGGIMSALLRGDYLFLDSNYLLNAEYSGVYIADGTSVSLEGNLIGGLRSNLSLTNSGVRVNSKSELDVLVLSNNTIEAKVALEFSSSVKELIACGNDFSQSGTIETIDENSSVNEYPCLKE